MYSQGENTERSTDVLQVDTIVGSIDGLLGSITKGGSVLNLIIDNLGNIVQSVAGAAGQALDQIVGNYQSNMTYTGVSQNLAGGNVQKQYSYGPLGAVVDIIFNSAGQIRQATVVKQTGGGGSSSTATSSATMIPPSSSTSSTVVAPAPVTTTAAPPSSTTL